MRHAAVIFVGIAILGAMLRTFTALGWLMPMVVVGSSMAPGLPGEHLQVDCPRCQAEFLVGSEMVPPTGQIRCPNCGEQEIDLTTLPLRPGRKLSVDRTTHEFERGEVVVLRNPERAREYCLKRIIGLPGEEIAIRDGDVWINNRRWHKDLRQQLAVRQLVHRETPEASRWRKENDQLVYRHPGDGIIRDDSPYNQSLTRRLNRVRDVMLTCELALPPETTCQFSLTATTHAVVISIAQRDNNRWQWKLNDRAWQSLAGEPGQLLVSIFDHQVLLAVNEREVFREPVAQPAEPINGPQQLAITIDNSVNIRDPTLWRDIYYQQRRIDTPGPWRLETDAWFVVGDNQAVSLDSRCWRPGGAVPGRLLVGRLVGQVR